MNMKSLIFKGYKKMNKELIKNGNTELDITVSKKRYLYNSCRLIGWEGSANINGKTYTGEFGMIEDYEFDGETYLIDWNDFFNKNNDSH